MAVALAIRIATLVVYPLSAIRIRALVVVVPPAIQIGTLFVLYARAGCRITSLLWNWCSGALGAPFNRSVVDWQLVVAC